MARAALCISCDKTLHISDSDDLVCPVCSSSLIEVTPAQQTPA